MGEGTAITAFQSIGYSDKDIARFSQGDILEQLQWTENREEIGTHVSGSIWTLDEVYSLARNNWLVKQKNAEIYFKTDNSGIISTCGYVENGCQDGCFIAIHIVSIKK